MVYEEELAKLKKKMQEVDQKNQETKELEEKINNTFHKLYDSNDKYKENVYWVTELLYCPRKIFWNRKNNFHTPLNSNMLHGSLMHDLLPKLIEDDSIVYEKELELPLTIGGDSVKVVGRADAVMKDKVIEFKYTKILPGYLDSKRIPLQYHLQAGMYCKMTGLDEYYIIIGSVFNLDFKVIRGKLFQEHIDTMIKNAETIHNCLKQDVLPVVNTPMFKWECRYCPYKKKCIELKEKKEGKHDFNSVEARARTGGQVKQGGNEAV